MAVSSSSACGAGKGSSSRGSHAVQLRLFLLELRCGGQKSEDGFQWARATGSSCWRTTLILATSRLRSCVSRDTMCFSSALPSGSGHASQSPFPRDSPGSDDAGYGWPDLPGRTPPTSNRGGDPLVFAGTALAVLTAALLAFYLPALSAGKADPLIVMRDEESPWRMIMS